MKGGGMSKRTATDIDPALRLRGLIAMLRAATACAEGDVAKYGEWQCDYRTEMAQYSQQIESILGTAKGE